MGDDLWLVTDLETTGLVPRDHLILEAGVIAISAKDLSVVEESETLVRHDKDHILERLDDTVHAMHTKNGLLADFEHCRGHFVYGHQGLDEWLVAFANRLGFERGKVILVGNTVHFDRSFLEQHTFTFPTYLHYRHLDVRAMQVAYRAWHGHHDVLEYEKPHRALPDARRSLETLRFFRDRMAA